MAAGPGHAVRVARLYRVALRHLAPLCTHRWFFFEEAAKLRARFEENRHLTDPFQIEQCIRAGEAEFEANRHPDPYVTPYMYGGSRYMRNPPFPSHIKHAFDFTREPGTFVPHEH